MSRSPPPPDPVKPTSEDVLPGRLRALAAFLPVFQAPGFRFGGWNRPPPEGDFQVFPFFVMSPGAELFMETAYKFGWVMPFDWGKWAATRRAGKLRDDPQVLAGATADDIGRLLTVLIRQDRFVDGALAGAFESGLLIRILERTKALLDAAETSLGSTGAENP